MLDNLQRKTPTVKDIVKAPSLSGAARMVLEAQV